MEKASFETGSLRKGMTESTWERSEEVISGTEIKVRNVRDRKVADVFGEQYLAQFILDQKKENNGG